MLRHQINTNVYPAHLCLWRQQIWEIQCGSIFLTFPDYLKAACCSKCQGQSQEAQSGLNRAQSLAVVQHSLSDFLPWVQYNVSVTTGANQGLAALMITLLDAEDKAVLFRPYYFNALMAVGLPSQFLGLYLRFHLSCFLMYGSYTSLL